MKSMLGAEGKEGSALGSKVAAGMLSGALAAGISNPTDLIKTHMQKGGGAQGGPFTVLARVVRSEGVRGLWVGTTPSMVSPLAGWLPACLPACSLLRQSACVGVHVHLQLSLLCAIK